MKILHLATDDKFLDHAFPVFEKVYPGANDVFVFAANTPLKYVKLKPDHIETKRSGFFYKKPKLGKEFYEKYDLVIFHNLSQSTFPEFASIPEDTPTVWIGWGADYYEDLLGHVPLYLDTTKEIYSILIASKLRRKVAKLVKAVIRIFRPEGRKIRAIEKITLFSPVLPEEYDMVKSSRKWRRFPKFALWNYGTIEDNLIKGFEDESVSGDAILVGNSATYAGNHAEAFDLIHQLQVDKRQVVAPLSYGDGELAKKLIDLGRGYFGDNFESLMDFMPIEEYVSVIRKCGYVIMNHVRQQGVGNIVIMLYLGARVFVRQENPVYDFFRNSGVVLSTVQELQANPGLLETPLTHEQRARNRAFVSEYWSREKAYERTKKLVEKALSLSGSKSPGVLAESYQ